MELNGPEIQCENCNEYEFSGYSVMHDMTNERWELHFQDEEEGELFIYLGTTSFDEEQELFERLGFTKELFEKIIKFEENQQNV